MVMQKAVCGVLLVRSGNVSAEGTMPSKTVNDSGIVTDKRDNTPAIHSSAGERILCPK